jgi:pimeloyl-ACP methyl ester carboxylesterase
MENNPTRTSTTTAESGTKRQKDSHLNYPASEAPTQFAELKGRTIAFRTIGSGKNIFLCNRFRGNLDTWDPAFLDALAQKYQVIIFDYTGFGLSTGPAPTTIDGFVADLRDLMEAFCIDKCVVGGWSFGGLVAQKYIADYPESASHGILIGIGPFGKNDWPIEPHFYEVSQKLHYSLEDETVLFFEPEWEPSRKAAQKSHNRIQARKTDLDVVVPEKLWGHYTMAYVECLEDHEHIREKINKTKVPLLVIMGDHDISFPVQNWYALLRQMQSAQLIVFPMAGHGPQHEFPKLTSRYIHNFIKHS